MTKAAAIHDARREEAYLLLRDGDRVVLEPVVMPFASTRWSASALSGRACWRAPARPAAEEALGRRFHAVGHPPARCAVGGAAGAGHPAARPRCARSALSARAGCQTAWWTEHRPAELTALTDA